MIIKNLTFFAQNVASWEQSLKLGFQPDEAIVRSISYSGPDAVIAEPGLIKCSLTNDFIGHIVVNNYGTTVYPNTHINIKNTMNESITFSTHVVTGTGTSTQQSMGAGDLIISIDFIKH